jgi:RNA-directed DNA polymerase
MMTNDTRTERQVGHHGTAVVNGPEDELLDWHQVDWHQAEDDVPRLRQRIFTGLLEPGAVKVARPVLRVPGQ